MRFNSTRITLLGVLLFSGVLSAGAQSYSFSAMVPVKPDPKQLKAPAAVAINSAGNLFIMDAGTNTIQVFDPTGNHLETIKDINTPAGPVAFKKLKSIFIDAQDNLYVIDEALVKVIVRTRFGQGFSFGEKGGLIGQFEKPLAIAADGHGYIYVLNGKRKQVDVYHKNGDYLTFVAGAAAPFQDPAAIGVNGRNELYVLDRKTTTVYMFDQTGALLRSHASIPGITKVAGMAVFRNGDFFLLDAANQQISQFSREGKPVGKLGSKGKKADKGVLVNAVFIAAGTSREKSLAILDQKALQAQLFQVATTTPALQPEGKRMQYYTTRTTRPALSTLSVAPNGTRYALRTDNDKKFFAYKDSTTTEVFAAIALTEPVDLASDRESNVYVIDRKSKEVIMFDKQGVRLRRFGQDIPEKLTDPVAIAIQSNGNILVADKKNGNVHMWNSQGAYVISLIRKNPAGMESPRSMTVDSKDQIYIWDDKKNAIYRFTSDGAASGTETLVVRPEVPGSKTNGVIGGFFIDPLDQVHVFNTTTSQFEIFTWDQMPLPLFSYGKPGAGGFSEVESVLLDPGHFRVYVTEAKGKSQKVIQFVIKPPTPENTFVFEAEKGKLKATFNQLDAKTVVSYALLTTSKAGGDSVVAKTTSNFFLIDEPLPDNTPRLRKYRLASLSQTDMSDPTAGFDNYFGYANRLYAAGRFDDALSAYQLGLERMGRPQQMVAYVSAQLVMAGRKFASAYDMQKAMLFLRSAATLTPDDKGTQSGLVYGYARLFQQMANQEDFENLIAEAESAIQSAAIKSSILNVMDSVATALSKIPNENSIGNAVNLQKKLVEWDAGNPQFLVSLGNTSYELYKFKKNSGSPGFELAVIISEAQKYAEEAVTGLRDLKKPFLEAQLTYLEILNAGKDFEKAEQVALQEMRESSAQINKAMQVRFRKLLAEAYRGQSKFDLSIMEYQRVLQLEPDNINTRISLADVLIQAKKFDDAKLMYQQLLIKDRENADYIARIGSVELMKGNFDEASFQLEKAIKIKPAERALYGALAEAFDGAGKGEKALENYRIAIQYLEQRIIQARNAMTSGDETQQIQQQLNKYLANVANIYNNLGLFEEAIVAFQRVTTANPTSAEAFFGLGQAYLSSGLVYDAMKALYRAKTLDPNNQTYANAHFSAMSQRDQMVKNEPPFNIVDVRIKEIFPSLYKNYNDPSVMPMGELLLANNTAQPAPPNSITVTLFIPEIMTEPSTQKVPALVGFSNTPVKLSALLDEKKVLNRNESMKAQATIEMSYMRDGEKKSVSRQIQITIHGRNAISWTDKRRLASFVNPNVEALINYNKKIDVMFRDAPAYSMNKVVLKSMQVFTILTKSKFVYSPDPEQSFALVTTNTDILDYLQYPAETLVRRSGDCDDLVTVYSGLLENAGINTAYVDVPGHVFMAFDSQIKPNEIAASGFDPKDVIVMYEKVWIPIETTLIGTQSFLTAWKSAAERYYKELANGNFPEIVPMSDARKVYQPSTFVPEKFAEVEPVSNQEVIAEYQQQVSELLTKTKKEVLREMENRYVNEPQNVFVKNKYAMLLAQIGKSADADKILLEALALSPGNPAVLNNLGNVAYFRGDADRAIEFYGRAAAIGDSDGEIFVNLAKAWLMKNDKAQAKTWFQKAVGINGDLASLYDYLAKEIQ
jgi:tetratricopeptide (TPR) repeat protein/sugar lactone lactonase YvrE